MKLLIILTLLAFAILTLATCTSIPKLTTTSALTSSITHGQRIRSSSSALATPLSLPDWELKNRDRWIPIHNGRPCPNEDGCPQNVYFKPIKVTKRAAGTPNITSATTKVDSTSSALTFATMNVLSRASQSCAKTTGQDSATTSLSPGTTAAPLLTHNVLPGRQVAIPYIPADWTIITHCAAVFGSPCTTVSKYLPYLNDGARRASEEVARASSLIENGAFVPGMNVPGGAGMVEIGFAFVVAAFVVTMMAIMVVL